jgi:hypothetical protein
LRVAIEPLEPRTLLSGGISGTLYQDLNGDGHFTPGEPPLAGWTVYLDANRSGARDPSEAFTTTDASGQYNFANLAPGTYYVAEQSPAVWKQTSPGELGARLGVNGGVPAAADVARAVASLTTTRSTVPIHLQDTQANALIGLDSYQSDPRFSRADGRGYSIAILDTGADLDNPAFGPDSNHDGVADRIVYQHDFADNDNDASDHNGHGTNVASIAAGQDGMAPGANLIILKVFSDGGAGDFGDIESALQWCVANTARYNIAAVNMSLGDGQNWGTSQSLYGIDDELAALSGLNVMVASAAGNDYAKFEAQGVSYPAADPNSLAVGAVWDANDGGASWVGGAVDYSTGPDRITSFSQRSTALSDIFAPGAIISGAGLNGGTSSYSGTSQASPHIAGIAAWAQELAVEQLGRRLSFDEFRQLLRNTGITIHDGDDEDDNVVNTGADFERVQANSLGAAIYAMGGVLPYGYEVNVQDSAISGADFGNQKLETRPAAPDLVSLYDTGFSNSDNITLRNNATGSSKLQFQVGGLFPGAQVGIYSDGALIGSGTAGSTGGSLAILTNGSTQLTDGTHSITARQQAPGDTQSLDSDPLLVTIDTIAPPAPGMPDMQSASDSGISDSDNITRVRHPKFDVTTLEGGRLALAIDSQANRGSARAIANAGTYDMESIGGNTGGFLPALSIPGGDQPYALAQDDINHDGAGDLLVADLGSGTLDVYFGDGAGGFGAAVTSTVPGPTGVVTADFDHDGNEDIVVTNNTSFAYVLFGDGAGRFGNQVTLSLMGGNYVLDVAAADVNHDGNMDVIAAERNSRTLRVILGNGNRTFRPGTSYPAGGDAPFKPVIADMNNDGDADLLVANSVVDTLTVLLGNGDGSFGPPLSVATGDNPVSFFVGDYDRDGWLDVVATENGAHAVQFFHGNGDGTLTAGPSANVNDNNGPGIGADFNGDGLLDYATTAFAGDSAEVDLLYGVGDGTFLPYRSYAIGRSPFDIVTRDFNGDGLSDLVVANLDSNDLSLLIATAGGLSDGNHTAYATLEDAAGNVSSPSPSLQFKIDTTAPSALSTGSISPNPRQTPVLSIDVNFNEPIAGFDPADLALSRDSATISGALTLDTSDNQSWHIGALEGRTAQAGQYLLSFLAQAGVTDLAGNPLAGTLLSQSWIMNAINGTGADDQIHLARGANDHTLSVQINGAAAYTVDLSNLDQLHVNASAGDDVVDLDLSGGGLNFPGGIVMDGDAASSGDVLMLAGGSGDDSATFSGGSASLDGVAITLATSPRIVFAGGVGNDTFTLNGGAERFEADAFDSTANLQVNVNSGATAIFEATQHLGGLNIDGGIASMSVGGDKVLVTSSLAISGGGRLDLNDNDLLIKGGAAGTWNGNAYDGISGLIESGAIFSSTAQARQTTLGIATAGNLLGISGTQTGTWNGQTVSAGDVLVKFTYEGDANLDGKVNIDDYGRIDANVGQSGLVFGWYNGDFNFDGKINIDDYGLIDSVIGAQGPVL